MNIDNSLTLQNALILHTRPYQNSSLLVDFFTERDGIIRCVAKGARSKRKKIQLTPFCLYRINYSGRSELKTLKTIEPCVRYVLEKQSLFCGFYVNELALRLLYTYDPFPEAFRLTCDTLSLLGKVSTEELSRLSDIGVISHSATVSDSNSYNDNYNAIDNHNGRDKHELECFYDLEVVLRRFEFCLFFEIGYLMDMTYDCKTGDVIEDQLTYGFLNNEGFTVLTDTTDNQIRFSGKILNILSRNAFHELLSSPTLKKEVKILSRLILSPLLGGKPLQSKTLFEKFKGSSIS